MLADRSPRLRINFITDQPFPGLAINCARGEGDPRARKKRAPGHPRIVISIEEASMACTEVRHEVLTMTNLPLEKLPTGAESRGTTEMWPNGSFR